MIDTPIAETAIVGAAAGAAHMGLRPVCEMQFIDFISCAYSILTNYVATARYRAGLATPCAGSLRVEWPVGHRHGELVGLAVVVQSRGAVDLRPLRGKTVRG